MEGERNRNSLTSARLISFAALPAVINPDPAEMAARATAATSRPDIVESTFVAIDVGSECQKSLRWTVGSKRSEAGQEVQRAMSSPSKVAMPALCLCTGSMRTISLAGNAAALRRGYQSEIVLEALCDFECFYPRSFRQLADGHSLRASALQVDSFLECGSKAFTHDHRDKT